MVHDYLKKIPSNLERQLEAIKYSDILTESMLHEALTIAEQFTEGQQISSDYNFDSIADLCVDNAQAWRDWGNFRASKSSESLAGYFYAIALIHNSIYHGIELDQVAFEGCLRRFNKASAISDD